MKLKLFSDRIGRIICGEELSQDEKYLVIKNPVICNLIQPDANAAPQLSILPYVFLELFDISRHDDYTVSFNNADVTMIESVNGGDLNNLHNNLISNYVQLFDRVRNAKYQQQQTQQATAPAEAQPNVVEVK